MRLAAPTVSLFHLKVLIVDQQNRFRHRLRIAQVERSNAAHKQWRAECDKLTCQTCGGERHIGRKCRGSSDGILVLKKRIRRLAGINPVKSQSTVTAREWADWNSGKSGMRACGPGSWDNAVRAMEE